MLIKRWISSMNLMKLRLDFLFRDFSQHFGIYLFGGLCAQDFHSLAWDKKWLEVICFAKSKFIQPQPKYKPRKILKFNSLRKRLPRDIHWNQKQIGNCYLVSLWNKYHNTAEFLACIFSNSSITLAESHDVKQRFKSFWWISCWMCTSVPSGRIVHLFFLRGQ